jgi:tRNA(Ile)-lysidine synthase
MFVASQARFMDARLPAQPVTDAEAAELFRDLEDAAALVLAISGGPDSTALLFLAARWRQALSHGPKLLAVTIDHGIRAEAKREAARVKAFARSLGVIHRTLRWSGETPRSRLQERARKARYELLAREAKRVGAPFILTAHTLDDQAETVLFRLARGSGLAGLAGMSRVTGVPVATDAKPPVLIVRPFLEVPKARLIATVREAGVPFSDDPSNRDPRFARARLRQLGPLLADEGLDAGGLARFSARARRADAALAWAAAQASARLVQVGEDCTAIDAQLFAELPTELRLRVLERSISRHATEGLVELGKLEALLEELGLVLGGARNWRRTLAGALVALANGRITIKAAPVRRRGTAQSSG